MSRAARATVFAPATVANVAVGFDILGFPVDAAGDYVEVTRVPERGVVVESISGIVEGLPLEAKKNTATVGLEELIAEHKLPFGFRVRILKGIPLGSGMGGSAASAVAGLVAANCLLERPLSKEVLLRYALLGEYVASGAAHPDNVSPCLYGGLTLTRSVDPVEVTRIPVPRGILCVLVHPSLRLDTRKARGVLRRDVPLVDHVRQSSHLAGFIAGCFRNDLALIASSLSDVVIEPQRARLIPGFSKAKAAALAEGALGCSISGSGPSVFAWVSSPADARRVSAAIVKAFKREEIECEAWISPVSAKGARRVPQPEAFRAPGAAR